MTAQEAAGDAEQAATDDPTRWWGQPRDARAFHVFEGTGQLARSLCGRWQLSHDGDDPAVDPETDEYREGEDCKACCRKAGVLGGGAQ